MTTSRKKAKDLAVGDCYVRDRYGVFVVEDDPYTFTGYRVLPSRNLETQVRSLQNWLPDTYVTTLHEGEAA